MDASRTQQVTHGRSVWSWVALGAIGMLLAATIMVWMSRGVDDGVVVRTIPVVEVYPPTNHYRAGDTTGPAVMAPGTSVREGGAYVEAIPTDSPGLDVPGSGADVGAEPGRASHRGCPVKTGC